MSKVSEQREAMELALEALQWNWGGEPLPTLEIEAIEALKRALAEPDPWTPDDMAYRPGGLPMDAEQEPVAWMMVNEEHDHKPTLHWNPQEEWHITWKSVPLYASPPARKPLTDSELWEMWVESPSDVLRFARAIERAHGINEGQKPLT